MSAIPTHRAGMVTATALGSRPQALASSGEHLTAAALQGIGLRVSLDGVPVLHDVDVSVAAGRWTCIVGPNGAGKSTLIKALAGLLSPGAGRALIDGEPLERMSPRRRARRLAWLGQGEVASEDLRVYDLVMLGRLPHRAWLGAPGREDHAAVEQALRAMHGWAWRHRLLGQLSGGERQRVLLARALAVEATILAMDEPLTNLDPPHQVDWLRMVRERVDHGTTVVTVLHELSLALQADELVVMAGGRVFHQGSCHDSRTHAAVEAVFEGRLHIQAYEGQWLALPRF